MYNRGLRCITLRFGQINVFERLKYVSTRRRWPEVSRENRDRPEFLADKTVFIYSLRWDTKTNEMRLEKNTPNGKCTFTKYVKLQLI